MFMYVLLTVLKYRHQTANIGYYWAVKRLSHLILCTFILFSYLQMYQHFVIFNKTLKINPAFTSIRECLPRTEWCLLYHRHSRYVMKYGMSH